MAGYGLCYMTVPAVHPPTPELHVKLEAVSAALAGGEGLNRACIKFDTSPATYRRYLTMLELTPPRRVRSVAPDTEVRLRAVSDLVASGLKLNLACAQLGVGDNTYRRHQARLCLSGARYKNLRSKKELTPTDKRRSELTEDLTDLLPTTEGQLQWDRRAHDKAFANDVRFVG